MRLNMFDRGLGIRQRILLATMRTLLGDRVPDIARVLHYRGELFGDVMRAWTQRVMRGDSRWSVGERELFAAFTASRNQCVF